MPTDLRFADDEDALRYEPRLDDVLPRTDHEGARVHNWDVQWGLAMDELDRRLRSHQITPRGFSLGRLSPRSRDRLRDVVVCWFLHFVFLAADTQGDGDGFHARKARHYMGRANAIFDTEVMALDYDSDGSGAFSEAEIDRPQPRPFIRG